MFVEMLDDHQGTVTETAEAREEIAVCDSEDCNSGMVQPCITWRSAAGIDYAMCRECWVEESYVRVVQSSPSKRSSYCVDIVVYPGETVEQAIADLVSSRPWIGVSGRPTGSYLAGGNPEVEFSAESESDLTDFLTVNGLVVDCRPSGHGLRQVRGN